MRVAGCPYCDGPGGHVAWMDKRCRVVVIGDQSFPGFCRVVWNDHVKELTDLGEADRLHVFEIVAAVERALRDLLRPDKMNLAAMGTHVPHLHWHVVPRYRDDSHYPDPIWASPQRSPSGRKPPPNFVEDLTTTLAAKLGA